MVKIWTNVLRAGKYCFAPISVVNLLEQYPKNRLVPITTLA